MKLSHNDLIFLRGVYLEGLILKDFSPGIDAPPGNSFLSERTSRGQSSNAQPLDRRRLLQSFVSRLRTMKQDVAAMIIQDEELTGWRKEKRFYVCFVRPCLYC